MENTAESREADPAIATFRQEAHETIDNLEAGLENLLSQGPSAEEVRGLFRSAHNLKGAAHVIGCRELGEAAHVLEELLTRWRDQKLPADTMSARWALSSIEVLRDALCRWIEGKDNAGLTAPGEGKVSHAQVHASLRVPVAQLDAAVESVSELVIAHSKVDAHIRQFDGHGGRVGYEERVRADEGIEDLGKTLAVLQEQLMQMRLVACSDLLGRVRKSALDAAESLQKSVDIVVCGEDVRVDAGLVDQLRDPLVHMVRNSIAHGIEPSDERSECGKPERGLLTVTIERQGGSARIQVVDDGRGIQRAAVRAKALRQGLISESDRLSDTQTLELIFEPGFSTAAQVDDIAGRGVGMDVVRHNIEKLHGHISVNSTEGAGTVMTMTVPMNVSVLRGFHMRVGQQVFVLPAEQVVECVPAALQFSGAREDEGTVIARLREQAVPCIRLSSYLKASLDGPVRQQASARESLVIVEYDGAHYGLAVDEIVGERRTVLKPLGPFLSDVRCVSGASVLGNGEVGLLLDFARIATDICESQPSESPPHAVTH